MQIEKKHDMIPIDWGSKDLPTMPTIAQKLINLLSKEEKDTKEICELISQDPALTAKLLQIANSALYSLSSEVTSVRHAVVLLGQDEVIQLAIGTLLAKRFLTVAPELRKYADNLWRHLLTTAYIAKDFGSDIEEPDLYTLGLLHDIGWLVLMSQAPSIFLSITKEKDKGLAEIEQEWGIDHSYWGAKLLERWGLPEPFQIVAFRHHDPMKELAPPKYLLIISLANFLANKMGNSILEFEEEVSTEDCTELLKALDQDMQALEQMIDWAITEKPKIELHLSLISS